jgi:hypothetical protein
MLMILESATSALVSAKPVHPNTTVPLVLLATFMKAFVTVAVHLGHLPIPQSTLVLLVKVLAANAY